VRFVPRRLRQYPQVAAHNWLIHDLMVQYLTEVAGKYSRGRLVDIGCGTKPFAPLFAPYVDEHVGVDLPSGPHGTDAVDVIGSAYDTTLEDGSFDVVLCSEVLEHLETPLVAIEEMHRLLRTDGIVILTVPFFWHIHEAPRDFYRYTKFGLRYLLETGGFEVIEIRPLTGFIGTFSQLLVYFLMRLEQHILLRVIGKPLHYLIQRIALALNPIDKTTEFANLYGVVARRSEH